VQTMAIFVISRSADVPVVICIAHAQS
jgi:hypothetical protein